VRRALAFAVAVACVSCGSADADDLWVVDAGFSYTPSSQQDLPPAARLSSSVEMQVPLYFWTKIGGDRAALERIAASKVFPIQHVWKKRCATDVRSDNDIQIEGEEDIFVGQTKAVDVQKWDKMIAGLESEIKLNAQNNRPATFDWRTQSAKMNLQQSCIHSVLVKDADGRTLGCGGQSQCRPQIDLSR
jgi:hypothetical protein